MPIEGSAGTLDIENATLRSNAIAVLTNLVTGNDRVRESGAPALEVYGDPSHGGNEARLEMVSNTATVSSSAFTRLTSNAGVLSVKTGTDASDNGTITFGGFANERLRITSDGKVGIGTNGPAEKLDVQGSALITGSTYGIKSTGTLGSDKSEGWYRLLIGGIRDGASAIRTECKLQLMASGLHQTLTFDFNHMINLSQTSGNSFNLLGNDHYISRAGITKLRLADAGSNQFALDMYIDHDVVPVERDWTITLYTEGGSLISEATTFLEKITATPSASIELDTDTSIFGIVGSTTSKTLIMHENGNVGIGTTDPQYTLDVNGLASSKTSRVFEFTGGDNYARHFWICSFLDAPGYHTNQLIKINYSATYKRLTGSHSRNSIASGTVTLSNIWRYTTSGTAGEFQYVTLQDQKNELYYGQGRLPKWYYVRFNNRGYLVLSMSISDSNSSSYYIKGNVDFLTRPTAESADRIFNGTVYKDSDVATTEGFTAISDLYPTTGTDVDGWDSVMSSGSTAQNFVEATEGTIFKHGNVGIGTTNPFCRLEIYGSANGNASGSDDRAFFATSSGTALSNDTGSGSGVSVWSHDWVGSGTGFIAANATTFSDERLKKNIVDADDGECLDILRQLQPKKYNYVDVVQRGETPVWGFIAQEVEAILPYSTHNFQEYIPNIYELANVSSSNVITFTNFNTSNLEANATIIRVKTVNGGQENVTLTEVIDEHTIRVEEDLNEWTGSIDETGNVVTGNQLFIFGQRMEDVRGLKKDAIWTVATSALQEIDRQLQAEKAKVATLETQVADLLARVQTLGGA
jgi:hypothetical protein